MELKLENLTKTFGKTVAIDNLSLTVTSGIYGLLGPNGSGKTTLMRILIGNTRPEKGCVLYNGTDIFSLGDAYRDKVGYMPQESGVYREFTVLRFMQYMATLRGISRKRNKAASEEKLKLVNMWEDRFKKMSELSGGMRQRVMLAQAILADPEVLILDEPTSGVDPQERVQIRNLISRIGINRIVLISTHITADISVIANKILILKQGRLIAASAQEELLKTVENHVFSVIIDENEIPELYAKYQVVGINKQISGKITARIISDSLPYGMQGEATHPDLEDYYLSVFPNKGEK